MGKYDDMLDMPRPKSERPKMSLYDRAAQFAPFAALTGYESILAETARLTDRKIDFDEDVRAALDLRFRRLCERLAERPAVTLLRFCADERKEGGRYETVCGRLKKLDVNAQTLTLENGEVIALSDVAWIESDDKEEENADDE